MIRSFRTRADTGQVKGIRIFAQTQELYILYLELGAGYNTPVIIKNPFWQMTAQNPKATYACINLTQAACPNEIEHQSVCINADIYKVVSDIIQR